MQVFSAYRTAWQHLAALLPLFLGVRLLSLAVVAPLTAALIPLALSVSGQAALTDQDIAVFFASPLGVPVLLAIATILLFGSIIGVAAMTLHLAGSSGRGLAALGAALQLLVARLPAIFSYAARLSLRVLLIVLPFAVLALMIAQRMIGAYDINYYLSTQPPEFLMAVGLIGAVLAVMLVLLLSQLSKWAVSLHLVVFDGVAPKDAFAQSSERMAGRRVRLLIDLLGWAAIRIALAVAVAAVFGGLLDMLMEATDAPIRRRLVLAALVAGAWLLCGALISALGLGALAALLKAYHRGRDAIAPPQGGARLITLPRLAIGAVVGVVAAIGFTALFLARIEPPEPVEIIAHRGAAGDRPENTLASVRKAVEDDADWVEIDVQETADGAVVVMHDSDFMKLAGVDLKIWDATLDDLAGIDIGSWFDPSYSAERTPRLEEVLEITRDRSMLLIELKYYGHDEDLEARTIAIVEEMGMADQVATMSLKYPAVQKMKGLRPDWTSGVLAATAIGDLSRLDADFIAVSTATAGPKLVRSARAAGKELYVWTVNDPLEMSAMMSMGVDGIITDFPARARLVMARRAELTPPERLFLMLIERFDLAVDSITEDPVSP